MLILDMLLPDSCNVDNADSPLKRLASNISLAEQSVMESVLKEFIATKASLSCVIERSKYFIGNFNLAK